MSGKNQEVIETAGKCDYENQYKEMIETEIVSATKGWTDKSTMTSNPSVSTKNPSARKSLYQFTETLDVKYKTDVCSFGVGKTYSKSTKRGNVLWSNTEKSRGNTKTNQKLL